MQFFGAIGRHLLSGITNWLFGQLRDAGIAVPTELSFGSIFRLVLDILGSTLDRVLRIVERRVRIPGIADRIRRFLSFMTGVWEFVARLITEGPAALWRYVQERLSNLWETARGMIVDWIESTIIGQVTRKLLSMLDPTGIMAVVNSIIAFYRAVQSALEYARQILEIVNNWFDMLASIASRAIAGAATAFENLLDRRCRWRSASSATRSACAASAAASARWSARSRSGSSRRSRRSSIARSRAAAGCSSGSASARPGPPPPRRPPRPPPSRRRRRSRASSSRRRRATAPSGTASTSRRWARTRS